MKQLYSLLVFILLINLVLGCAPKAVFYFASGTGSFETGKSKLTNPYEAAFPETIQNPAISLSDTVVFTASAQPVRPEAILLLPQGSQVTQPAGTKYYPLKERQPNKLLSPKKFLQDKILRKSLNKLAQPENKPVHKLATISLVLGLASILFLLLTALFTGVAGVFSTLILLNTIGGLVTSRMALKQIRENPDRFSGKGRARAGFIISLVMGALFVLLAIIGIIFLVLFFSNFT